MFLSMGFFYMKNKTLTFLLFPHPVLQRKWWLQRKQIKKHSWYEFRFRDVSQEPDIHILQGKHENLSVWRLCKRWSHSHNPTVHPQGKTCISVNPYEKQYFFERSRPKNRGKGRRMKDVISNSNFWKLQITVFMDGGWLYICAEQFSVSLKEETTLLWVSGNIISNRATTYLD